MSAVRNLVVCQAMLLAVAGIVVGLGAAYGLTRLMTTMVYAVKPTDPLVFGSVTTLLGGWKTGVIASMQTGAVFTVYSSVNQTNAFPSGSLRADLVGDPKLPESERSISRWFNTAAFRIPAQFRFGTAGRSILEGPGLVNLDVSFLKTIPIRERLRAELRAEFFNFFNRVNFGLPGHSVGNPNFGIISSASPGRSTQLAARVEF
ncbi:MAG: hypothetical protein HY235_17430 [Acidobacteria bacterium]|nr:hypothetical protein [Acidobacteriota bacterium]